LKSKSDDRWKELPRWELLQRKVQRKLSADATALFRSSGVESIIIKGLAAHINYPDTHFRNSVDVDIAVSPAYFDRANQLLQSDVATGLNIDLHKGLRHLDTLSWEDLFANSRLVDIDGTPIRMLRPEDHFRVLCVHWLNDGGQYRERLWDIYYAVANRPADFDWSRCLDVVSAKRRRWIVCAIGISHKYLGLYIDDLPFADEAWDLPKWLIRTIEAEWASDVRLLPMSMYYQDPRQLWKQIKKRIPPNPIESIIETEGSFDARFRLHYQIAAGAKRLGPSLGSVWRSFRPNPSK
jgi:Uncharacterised nucleotidyltransferase